MNILAIPATNSENGINRQLLGYAARLIEEGAIAGGSVEFIDLNDYEVPIYSPRRQEEGGVPALCQDLFAKIGAADAVIVSFAEYNGSFTPAWKNTFDWMSRIDRGVYHDKPVLMLAASPGGRAGAGILGSAAPTAEFFGAKLVGQLGVGNFAESFDSEAGEVTDPAKSEELRSLIAALAG